MATGWVRTGRPHAASGSGLWIGTSSGLTHWDGAHGSTFTCADGLPHAVVSALTRTREVPMKRYRRSRTDRKLAGVCGGLGAYLGVDPTVVRQYEEALPFVQVTRIEGAGSAPHLEKPEIVREILLDFIAEQTLTQ